LAIAENGDAADEDHGDHDAKEDIDSPNPPGAPKRAGESHMQSHNLYPFLHHQLAQATAFSAACVAFMRQSLVAGLDKDGQIGRTTNSCVFCIPALELRPTDIKDWFCESQLLPT
jgi:hypothetical protein